MSDERTAAKVPRCGLCGYEKPKHALSCPNVYAAQDRITAMEERIRNEDVFFDCQEQAREWIAKHGTQALVDELREAREQRRRIKLGTPNTLILLAHIDRLEAELSKPPLVKP